MSKSDNARYPFIQEKPSKEAIEAWQAVKGAWRRKSRLKAYAIEMTQYIIQERVRETSKKQKIPMQEAWDVFKSQLEMGDVEDIVLEVFGHLDTMIEGNGLKKRSTNGIRGFDAMEEEVWERREASRKGGMSAPVTPWEGVATMMKEKHPNWTIQRWCLNFKSKKLTIGEPGENNPRSWSVTFTDDKRIHIVNLNNHEEKYSLSFERFRKYLYNS